MSNCTAVQIDFPAFKRRNIEAQSSGGAITSDGGVLLLRSIDQRLHLTERAAALLPAARDPERLRHRWSICCGNGFMAWLAARKI